MDKRMIGGILVLVLGLLLGICNIGWPIFSHITLLSICLTIGISILMLRRCKCSDVMADPSAALTGCMWGILLGISLVAGWFKLLTKRRMHPYDEAAYGIICVMSLLLALIVWLFDITHNQKKLSFRRFLLQSCIAASLVVPMVLPAMHIMMFFEGILSQYVS